MAQPITVTVTGAVQAAPSATNALVPSLLGTKPFGINRTYAYRTEKNISINAPVSPVTLDIDSITKVRFCVLTVIGASVEMRVTSASGTDQAFKVSEFFMWSSPSEGDQWTSIKLLGVTDLEFILLGD
jgi:hypothetical protein